MRVPLRGHPLKTMRTTTPKDMTRNTHVIWVAGHAPPAGRKQFRSLFGRHIFEVCSCNITRSAPMWSQFCTHALLGLRPFRNSFFSLFDVRKM
jgi:hypothetical protein